VLSSAVTLNPYFLRKGFAWGKWRVWVPREVRREGKERARVIVLSGQ